MDGKGCFSRSRAWPCLGDSPSLADVSDDLTARSRSNESKRALAAETWTSEVGRAGKEDAEASEVGRPRLQARHQHTTATRSAQDSVGASMHESCQRTSPQFIGLATPGTDNKDVVVSAAYSLVLCCTALTKPSRGAWRGSVLRQYVNFSKSRCKMSWSQPHSRTNHLSCKA